MVFIFPDLAVNKIGVIGVNPHSNERQLWICKVVADWPASDEPGLRLIKSISRK